MERRREPRILLRQQVTVSDLTTKTCLDPSEIIDYSGRGISLLVSRPVGNNSPVRIEWQGMTLLGHVCYQQPFENRLRIGLQLNHALACGRDLAQLLKQLQEAVTSDTAVPLL